MSEVKVSIVCTVYNHEEYIREALDGFVSQKTNFAFEALVHDDASTDNSAEIIREYEQKYPDIIKPIYQIENQYSQGRNILLDILLPQALGEYIAICEGDDCWIDPHKLQRQYDLLEERQDVDICTHNAKIMYQSHCCGQTHLTNTKMDIISFEDVVGETRGFIPTMSVMMRKSVFKRSESNFLKIKCFDIALFIAGSLRGGMLALSDVMSVYHIYTSGSWNMRNKKSDNQLRINNLTSFIQALEQLNQDTNYAFDSILEPKIQSLNCAKLLSKKKYSEIVSDPLFENLDKSRKIYVWLSCFHINWLVKSIRLLYRSLKSSRLSGKKEGNTRRSIRKAFRAPYLPYEIPSYYFGFGSYPTEV